MRVCDLCEKKKTDKFVVARASIRMTCGNYSDSPEYIHDDLDLCQNCWKALLTRIRKMMERVKRRAKQ